MISNEIQTESIQVLKKQKMAPTSVLEVKKHSELAQLPSRGSLGAAGYDLFASKETLIKSKGKAIVPTDISIKLPLGTYGRIAPRSSLAVKHFLDVGAGVIDSDYRGLVGVVMFNFSDEDFNVKVGDRIAQLVVEKIETPTVVEVEELDLTTRGQGGYGSTGL
jgi:dUTP pyrophosphatase